MKIIILITLLLASTVLTGCGRYKVVNGYNPEFGKETAIRCDTWTGKTWTLAGCGRPAEGSEGYMFFMSYWQETPEKVNEAKAILDSFIHGTNNGITPSVNPNRVKQN
jgi:hypothetical protein